MPVSWLGVEPERLGKNRIRLFSQKVPREGGMFSLFILAPAKSPVFCTINLTKYALCTMHLKKKCPARSARHRSCFTQTRGVIILCSFWTLKRGEIFGYSCEKTELVAIVKTAPKVSNDFLLLTNADYLQTYQMTFEIQ